MGNKREGERETEEQEKTAAAAPDAKKRRSGSPTTDDASSCPGAAASLCDDVVGNILARVPARTAVASMALSRRHRRLIRSLEFRSLHRRLAPPLPRPHIAYLVTSTVKTRIVWKKQVRFQKPEKDEVPTSVFHGFHVAGAGGFNGGNAPAPMRSLVGPRFSDVEYINSCNGVVLLAAGDSAQCRCILWNPAVADAVEEVSVSVSGAGAGAGADADASSRVKLHRTLGLGYSQRSKTYKLILLCCRRRKNGTDTEENYSLVTYALADLEKQPTEVEVPAVRGREIGRHSLYMDCKIYLLCEADIRGTHPAAILAFDVDDETVSFIDLPIVQHQQGENVRPSMSRLLDLSGRPCVVTRYKDDDGCDLWLLSVDHQWHRRCLFGELRSETHIFPGYIIGVWDCDGVLVVCYGDEIGHPGSMLFLYDITTGKMFRANLEGVTLECSDDSDLEICWGYRPTLEAPSSVVGKLKQDMDGCRECSTYIMKALKPVAEQDRKKGQEATLNTVCFMDFLVRIMEKLPRDMQQVLEMKMVDSDDPDFIFENVLFED